MINLNGIYYSKIKRTQKIYLPKPFFNHLKGNNISIQKSTIGCLKLYDRERRIKATELLRNMLNPFDDEEYKIFIFFVGMFSEVKVSKDQTIKLTSDQCSHASIIEEIVLYQSNSYIAVWSKEKYDEYIERKHDPDYEEDSDMMDDIF